MLFGKNVTSWRYVEFLIISLICSKIGCSVGSSATLSSLLNVKYGINIIIFFTFLLFLAFHTSTSRVPNQLCQQRNEAKIITSSVFDAYGKLLSLKWQRKKEKFLDYEKICFHTFLNNNIYEK